MHAELAATLRRIDASTDHGEVRVGPPVDDGWVRVRDAIDDEAHVAAWYARFRADDAHPPDVAGAFLAGAMADVLVDAPATALQTERRAWSIDPDQTWLRPQPDGWFDGIAVGDVTLRVLPADPAAGAPGVEVIADVATLRGCVAADVVAVLDPLFGALRALAPFGRRGMWGALADGLAGSAVWTALRTGTDTSVAFLAAMALADDIAAAGGGPLNRPAALPIDCRHGTVSVAVRGTCCLWYKAPQDATGDDRYCTSCPRRDAISQRALFTRWLDEQTVPPAPVPP